MRHHNVLLAGKQSEMREVWIVVPSVVYARTYNSSHHREDELLVWKFLVDHDTYDRDMVKDQWFSSREEAQLQCEISCAELKEFQFQTCNYDFHFLEKFLNCKCSWPEIESHFAIELSPKLKV